MCVCVSGRSQVNTSTSNSREHTRVWSVVLACSRLIRSLSLAVGGLHSVKFCLRQPSILRPTTHTVRHLILLSRYVRDVSDWQLSRDGCVCVADMIKRDVLG